MHAACQMPVLHTRVWTCQVSEKSSVSMNNHSWMSVCKETSGLHWLHWVSPNWDVRTSVAEWISWNLLRTRQGYISAKNLNKYGKYLNIHDLQIKYFLKNHCNNICWTVYSKILITILKLMRVATENNEN